MLEAAEPRAKGSVRQPTQLEERHLNGGDGSDRIPAEPECLPTSIMAGVEFLVQWAPTGEVRFAKWAGWKGFDHMAAVTSRSAPGIPVPGLGTPSDPALSSMWGERDGN